MRSFTLLAVLLSLTACIAITGCDSSDATGGDRTEFKNESSATVTVSPGPGESFERFILNPAQSHKVKREGSNIDYRFTSTKRVSNVDVTNIEVLFIDPINL